jgi:transcriptional regulator with XRE-family HTH domain
MTPRNLAETPTVCPEGEPRRYADKLAIGRRVAAARFAAGLSVPALARRARVRVRYVERLESGDWRRLDCDSGMAIMDALGLDWEGALAPDGAPLRALREGKSMTVADVCRDAGISPDALRVIESRSVGSADPSDFVSYLDTIGVEVNAGFRAAGFLRHVAAPVLA